MYSPNDVTFVQNPFNLQTYQRRLRHLQCIAVRNLLFQNSQDIEFQTLQVYFTLHKDEKSQAFLTSEKITGSLNPTWQNFDLQRHDQEVDLTAKFFIVRVWIGTSDKFTVKLESHIHLSGLVFFADKLQVSGTKHAPNTLFIGMHNNFFCRVDMTSASVQLQNWLPDLSVPKGAYPASVWVDQSTLRPSYNVNYLSRIHTVLRAIKQTHASVQKVHTSIEDKLVSSTENSNKLSKRESLLIKVRQLQKELLWQTQQKQKDEDELSKYRAEQDVRSEHLKNDRHQLQNSMYNTKETKYMYIQSREMLLKENAQVLLRRKQIISELVHCIFPIVEDDKHTFLICNVRLPNAEDYQGNDETMIAVALGYACHLTITVSHFLDMPLRYPMIHRGSRSLILDHVHSKLAERDREFPLYGKGKEKFQYNYAVFLLNKNISQMRFYCGLGTSDLRQTLPNLKSLLEQRLGTGNERGHPHLHSPHATSFGGSQISRQSMAASTSTPSFLRKDPMSDMDPGDSLSCSPSHKFGRHSSTAEGLDLASLDINASTTNPHFASSKTFRDMMNSGMKTSMSAAEIKSPGSDFNNGYSSKAVNGFNGRDISSDKSVSAARGVENWIAGAVGSSSKNDGKDRSEDEDEDLFKPSDDAFFTVRETATAQFLKSFPGLPQAGEADSNSFQGRENIPREDSLLSPSIPPSSFKLVKKDAFPEKSPATPSTSDSPLSPHNQMSPQWHSSGSETTKSPTNASIQ